MLTVRKAVFDDLDVILSIYKNAQEFMIGTGNPDQWGRFHPPEEMIREDIKEGICHVICEEGNIHGVFALCSGVDPTYIHIEDGRWLNDESYITIHRIAGDQKVHGILKCAADYCKGLTKNIRIDTHEDNIIMQKALAKNGFVRCGVIYIDNGDPRIAFQWSGER